MICFIGIDGSGKTTHARRTVSHIQESGEKCRYVWFGAPYFFSYPFMATCRVLGLTKTYRLPNNTVCFEHQYYKNKPAALMWPWVQFLDIAIFLFLRVYRPLKGGFTVVCDRFLHDNLVELMVDSCDEGLHLKLVGQLILRLQPELSKILLLDVNESFAFRRRLDLPNLDYLVQRKRKYYLIANHLHVPVINAERPLSVVHEEIMKRLEILAFE